MSRPGARKSNGLFVRELRLWGALWHVPDLDSRVTVVRNLRLRTTLARYVVGARTIELGPGFFRLRKRRLAAFCHEAAHAAVALRFGTTEAPHGPTWAGLVGLVGYPTEPTWSAQRLRAIPKRHAVNVSGRRMAYEHRCPVCQFQRLAGRPIRRWRCPECAAMGLPGVLIVTRKATAKEAR